MFAPFMLVETSFSKQVISFLHYKIFEFAHKLLQKTFTDSSRKVSRRHYCKDYRPNWLEVSKNSYSRKTGKGLSRKPVKPFGCQKLETCFSDASVTLGNDSQ